MYLTPVATKHVKDVGGGDDAMFCRDFHLSMLQQQSDFCKLLSIPRARDVALLE